MSDKDIRIVKEIRKDYYELVNFDDDFNKRRSYMDKFLAITNLLKHVEEIEHENYLLRLSIDEIEISRLKHGDIDV